MQVCVCDSLLRASNTLSWKANHHCVVKVVWYAGIWYDSAGGGFVVVTLKFYTTYNYNYQDGRL